MRELAHEYLNAYARGEEIEGGWAFAKALRQAQLDLTDDSLERLELFLQALRREVRPAAQAVRETTPGRNLCALLAFYLIEVVQRRTGATIEWHTRDDAAALLPLGTSLPDMSFTRLVAFAADHRVLFMPLGWVERRVLGIGQQHGTREFIDSLVARLNRDGPAAWRTAMNAVGRMASWQMMFAAEGGRISPTLMTSHSPSTFLHLTTKGDGGAALQRGAQLVKENPRNAMWQVLSYDGMACLEQGRCDAIMVVVHSYGTSPLRLKIAFPYRQSKDGRVSAVLDPTLVTANVEPYKLAMLNGSMRRGIESIKWPFGTTWDQLRA
ncbi:hypothetical protein AACH06_28255 [Ideonella sp. DXS29W]|uniref:Uncharacterized protein n=1 Tax=Ideonella lacteola TaxID=2984193 RepID=A0ABU9BY84_9BURK